MRFLREGKNVWVWQDECLLWRDPREGGNPDILRRSKTASIWNTIFTRPNRYQLLVLQWCMLQINGKTRKLPCMTYDYITNQYLHGKIVCVVVSAVFVRVPYRWPQPA